MAKDKKQVLAQGTLNFTRDEIPSVTEGKSNAMDFMHALNTGNPHAKRLFVEATKKDKELSLADKYLVGTYQWAKYFNLTAKERKNTEHIPAAVRRAMRVAHRFELDDEFTAMVTEVSSRTPAEKLLYRLQFSTIPYDKVWIEFNLKVKVRAMRRFHGLSDEIPYGVAERMGVLIERVDERMATVTMVCEQPDDKDPVTGNLAGYIFSVDERSLKLVNVKYNGHTPFALEYRNRGVLQHIAEQRDLDDATFEIMLRSAGRGSLWGYATGKPSRTGIVDSNRDFMMNVRVPTFLERHGELTFSPQYEYFEMTGRGRKFMEPVTELIGKEVIEFSGMMRWIITVLAMLNEVPVRSHFVIPKHHIKIGLTERRPALDFHRLTLTLPKIRPVPFIERQLSNVERHHKAHDVRQHWRTYLAETPCGRENHAWEYDYAEGYRLCGRCMSFSRLIHEHVRGDPSLGWVRKDYVLKPSRQI